MSVCLAFFTQASLSVLRFGMQIPELRFERLFQQSATPTGSPQAAQNCGSEFLVLEKNVS